ncbi:MAG: hypothetical protein A3I24_02880 [Candidatus Harrisonbacteria bacterium RIFCSPLOWO2_02_FULL_41_13b]|uniref:Methyltransferase type 11 domain-containing protein n=1 Tax=Candidatus Harrisonbacteria bacterium RIFCSPLOWO2_02_FULL_41_13b TaxID=1798409 RepID=A0A1G1ZRL3_9BACT|nr:MAG: hypothetical protein A3J53_01910 [Candidatus Harrisonbacteria bacterium RIFCSPHIGHO2_02_FULL_40_20]OGY67099.1 MAG: hypothetical protein A3I24_02880 [Candidatus Harrisonbacteria bacterium RIFCSPLOWO2_02_FULL_41_13b]
MKYFTPEELKITHREEISSQLSTLAGKNVKHNFAIWIFKKYAEKLGWNKNIKILDLGTANGDFLIQLNQTGYQNLYAHDIDAYLSEERKILTKEYKFSELSMERLPWPDNYFDAITAWCVIPHLENPFFCAREARRVLKPGGVFIFTTLHLTSKPSLQYFLKNKDFKSYRETNNHISLLPNSVVKKTILKDFELAGVEYFVNPKVFNNWQGKIRKIIWNLCHLHPDIENWLKNRWAYNICYIAKKI